MKGHILDHELRNQVPKTLTTNTSFGTKSSVPVLLQTWSLQTWPPIILFLMLFFDILGSCNSIYDFLLSNIVVARKWEKSMFPPCLKAGSSAMSS